MKKKILFVIDSLNCGGAEKSLVSLLPLLDKKKYEIYLWIRYRGGVFENYIPNHVHIISNPTYNIFERALLLSSKILYSLAFRLYKILGKKRHGAELLWRCEGWIMKGVKGNYDVAIAYQQGLPTYLVAKKIQANKKIAWVNCNIFNAGYSKSFNDAFYKYFPKITLVSQELFSIFSSEYNHYLSKLECIYDILNPFFIKKQAKEQVNDITISKDETIIVTTGRLAYQKNHRLAVETAKVLKDKGIHFRWYFVGEGNERNSIENLINNFNLQECVILLGLRQNPYPYMAACDIYVQTSRFEGFGLTIAEAKILGKPVVSTNFDVVHDQITHEKNGLISEMNAGSLSEQIIRMIKDETLRKSIIKNVQAEENTTYITEVKKVERLLDEA